MGFTKKETVVENVEEEVKEEEVKKETTENEVVEVKGSIQDVLDNDPVLKRICQSGYFMMRQHSDIIDSKKFDHATFVDKESVEAIMKNKFELAHIKNECVIDDYVQLFISEAVFEKHQSIFNYERNGINYSVVDKYDDVFAGFIRTENYFILINSDNFEHKYGVYILIDGSTGDKYICNDSKEKLEFYGFINIGYLIDPLGYVESDLKTFEDEIGTSIPPLIRSYLSNSSVIKHGKQIFHIDLKNYNESVKTQYIMPSKSYTNSQHIREINNNNNDESILSNKTFIDNMLNGFLYIGLINKIEVPMQSGENVIKRTDSVYILINFMEQRGIDFSSTLWQYTILNSNAEKLLKKYTEKNAHKTFKQFDKMERKINIHDPGQIIHSMKYLTNIYN